jgi:hypothetical protein
MGMEACKRRRTNEFVLTNEHVNGRDSAGFGITRHATALRNASRPSVRRQLLRSSEGAARVLHLDRHLGIIFAKANVRALEHNVQAERVQAGDMERLQACEASGCMSIDIECTHDKRNTLLHRRRCGSHVSAVEHDEEASQVLRRVGTH